jgi:hypothetical protein
MKKRVLPRWFTLWICLPFSGLAQQLPDTSGLTINLLQVPNSAAFSLMDLAPSTIEEPKVPADFVAFVRQATDSFTILPRNYGIEFAPAWIFGRNNIDFSKFSSNRLGQNIWQSLTFSVGVNHLDDPNLPPGNDRTTQLGFGLKMSLWRGTVEAKHSQIDSLYRIMSGVNDSLYQNLEAWFITDPKYKLWYDSLTKLHQKVPISETLIEEAGAQWELRTNALLADSARFRQQILSSFSPQINRLRAQVQGMKLNRRGFKLDFAAGMASDFYDQSVTNSQVTRVGAWLTGGWVFNPNKSQLNTSLLGMLRILGNPRQLYRSDTLLLTQDNLFLDYGGRLILHNGKRFSLSTEVLGRVTINNDALKPTARYVVNMDYQLTSSIVLSFHLGKNFDGTVTKSGNLITALQLFSSFGKRSYQNGRMR